MGMVQFSKYNGCRNDFICFDCRYNDIDLEQLALKICPRDSGIGADGVIGVYQSSVADLKMVIVNSDGSIPEMCGNGIRCLMAYALDKGLLISNDATIETGAGILAISMVSSEANQSVVRVDMGQVQYGDRLPIKDFDLPNTNLEQVVALDGVDITFIPISMGNPHAVIFVDDVESVLLNEIGPQLEQHDMFPNRVNVEFVEIMGAGRMKMRVWERGVGETSACGTGACASVVASVLTKNGDTESKVILKGGVLLIRMDTETDQIIMEGPVEFEFESSLEI